MPRPFLHAAIVAVALAAAGCAGLPSPAPERPSRSAPDRPSPSVADHEAREASLRAMSLVGTPYRHGGNTPESGFDCSGLIGFVYREAAGRRLPRTVAQIAASGTPIAPREARAGDLLIFDTQGPRSHAAIYVGGDRFVHAPSAGGTVRLDSLSRPYWRARLSGALRF